MNNYFKILIIVLTFALASFLFFDLTAQSDGLGLGVRYIKLGNTYREAHNYEKATEFLNKGKNIAERYKSWDGRYWSASAYESLGFLFREIGMKDESDKYFSKALSLFRSLIKMPGGSPEALDAAMKSSGTIDSAIHNNLIPSASTGLVILNYDKQRLKEVPNDIPLNVKNLSLSENRFNQFPSGLFRYKKLEYLNLSDNKIKSIPENIDELSNLHYLDLSNNRLKNLPVRLGFLSNLMELNLEGNRLKDVPPSLCSLQNLKLLNLKNNNIPFEKLTNIVKCLPNTNVLFDEYILKAKSSEEENPE